MRKNNINIVVLLLEVALIILLHAGKSSDYFNKVAIKKSQSQPSVILTNFIK